MERKVLFRGFSEDKNGSDRIYYYGNWIKGKWVFGSPIYQDNYVMIRWWDSWEFKYQEELVLSDTVAQFTGRHDVKGEKIWEKDIIRASDNNGSLLGTVVWNENAAQFMIGSSPFGIGEFADFEMEVLGNIFSNHEL